jgi:hypothetical protein
MCRAVRLPLTPNNNTKAHITSFQPVLNSTSWHYVHHILAYDCPNVADSELEWQGDCFYDSMPQSMHNCMDRSVVLGWSVGGDVFYYPVSQHCLALFVRSLPSILTSI